MKRCKICGSSNYEIVYEGPIRIGKFGSLSRKAYLAAKCLSCSVISLPKIVEDHKAFYESTDYRKEVEGSAEVQDYFSLHDGEQSKHFTVTGTSIYRNKIVADIGCGAGAFLDYVQSVSKTAIAIEPAILYRTSLTQRGYVTYPYACDALVDFAGKVDVAVSFSVVEHVEDPMVFLNDIRQLLCQKGKLILSTPNTDDALLEMLPDVYAPFFYRKAHLWYFNAESLRNLLGAAGFKEINIVPFHRFGLGNFLTWIRDRVPKGDARFAFITETVDSVWRRELERTGRSDYLYAVAS